MSLCILIAVARRLVHPEAVAIGAALKSAGAQVRYLDATLRVHSDVESLTAASPAGAATMGKAKILDWLKRVLLSSNLTRAAIQLRGILRDRIRLTRILGTEAPDAVVIFDDRRVRPELVLARLASTRGISVIIAPFAASTIESDAYMRRHQPNHQVDSGPNRAIKRWVARRWPGQCLWDADGILLFYDLFDTLIIAATGLLARNPWVLGGSEVDLICATGSDHQRYLLDGGVPPERIVISGQASLDRLVSARKERVQLRSDLVARYQIKDAKPIVVCAVPQYAEHRMTNWEHQRSLVDELFGSLSASGASVLLSLHPRSRRKDYEEAARRHHLTIIEQRLADALPAADLLVATFSSTVSWAIGLGIPAIVVDALATNFRLYRDAPGVTVLDNHAQLRQKLARFVNDGEFRAALVQQATIGSARAGALDGGASGRIAQAIVQTIGIRSRGSHIVAVGQPTSDKRVMQ